MTNIIMIDCYVKRPFSTHFDNFPYANPCSPIDPAGVCVCARGARALLFIHLIVVAQCPQLPQLPPQPGQPSQPAAAFASLAFRDFLTLKKMMDASVSTASAAITISTGAMSSSSFCLGHTALSRSPAGCPHCTPGTTRPTPPRTRSRSRTTSTWPSSSRCAARTPPPCRAR